VTAPWQQEVRDSLLTAVYVALAGPIVGLLWWQAAPKLSRGSLAEILVGSEAPFRGQIGADAWFLLLSAVAGAVCALIVVLLRGYGPGPVLGLAAGGVAAGIVADRVGYLAQRAGTRAAMHAVGIVPRASSFDLLDFKVRALGVVVAWPIAALVVYLAALAIADRPRSLP
jgi:hypothetical protein